jgi:hypothetical protein
VISWFRCPNRRARPTGIDKLTAVADRSYFDWGDPGLVALQDLLALACARR